MSQETQTIKITDRDHLRQVHQYMGVVIAHETLGSKNTTMPGYSLAVALVAVEMNERKARCSFLNIKEVTKAGIDLDRVKSLSYTENGEIVITFYDLVEMAEKEGERA